MKKENAQGLNKHEFESSRTLDPAVADDSPIAAFKVLVPIRALVIHDHFDGSAHCVECGGHCRLQGPDLAVTRFIRFTLEWHAYRGVSLWSFQQEALTDLGINHESFMRRAAMAYGRMQGLSKPTPTADHRQPGTAPSKGKARACSIPKP